ncbi:hypothetical protein [Clostridium ljungdahlii]|uniref:Uncharacterized protein n=1 Tax=Clostridium ljungdahlii (strain ATCC 55383 / DSM 13528 / PETC) TaxID=748727 RepID=D8GU70_CLOLD|nr:hypothetical protein [Clostridium ljungdahlii]ADK14733.1 hypothetical protein CLJU_c16690 [Clostridium ljungdahlii DSM 13528]OAA84089.1 hypothetical protein WX45_01933 [Clostridium ljungdahlii DSM 13528]
MKISDFNKDRELQFYVDESGKEQSKIVEPTALEGKIKFHALNKEILNKVSAAINRKAIEYDELTYKVIPIITNVEMDISLQDFKALLSLPPNNLFINFIDQINNEFINLVQRVNKFKQDISKVNDEINKSIESLPKELKDKVEEAKLTDEEKLAKIEQLYSEEKDTKKKHDLLLELAKLQSILDRKKNNEGEM